MHTRTPVPGKSLFLLALLVLAPALAGAAEAALDPARVGWSEIRMTASKFFLTAESRLALRTVTGATVTPDLLVVADQNFTPLAPGTDVLELVYDTRGVGRKSRLTLLMDPVSGAAIQRVQHDQDGKPRFRTYRFGVEGAYHRTFWPATASEKSLQPKGWTKTSEGLRAYPVPPGKQPVIEPTGLLYAIAAAALDNPGDTADMLVFRRRDTQTVRITVLPSREISVRYDEVWPTGTVQRNGKRKPLRLSLQGMPVPGSNPNDDDLELLGLRGKLELLLDPATRAPLQLSGDVKILGKVTLRLAELHPR
ncbi:MAG: hypothetical protein E4H19_04700 [Chromatiales bacterium]|jgi:hypothetical protein|nr:MAG: hypothetical protein E4H19_04700 [Chromatiales bacterium]